MWRDVRDICKDITIGKNITTDIQVKNFDL